MLCVYFSLSTRFSNYFFIQEITYHFFSRSRATFIYFFSFSFGLNARGLSLQQLIDYYVIVLSLMGWITVSALSLIIFSLKRRKWRSGIFDIFFFFDFQGLEFFLFLFFKCHARLFAAAASYITTKSDYIFFLSTKKLMVNIPSHLVHTELRNCSSPLPSDPPQPLNENQFISHSSSTFKKKQISSKSLLLPVALLLLTL